jgi:hypothetical protein
MAPIRIVVNAAGHCNSGSMKSLFLRGKKNMAADIQISRNSIQAANRPGNDIACTTERNSVETNMKVKVTRWALTNASNISLTLKLSVKIRVSRLYAIAGNRIIIGCIKVSRQCRVKCFTIGRSDMAGLANIFPASFLKKFNMWLRVADR